MSAPALTDQHIQASKGSWRLVQWAITRQPEPRASDKLVLIVLAAYADPFTRTTQRTVQELAHHTGLDRKTVMRSLDRLEQLRLISVTRDFGAANAYHFAGLT